LGSISVAICRDAARNATPIVLRMMKNLNHRGSDAFGVASPKELVLSEKISELEEANLRSPISMAYGLMRIFPKDIPQPVKAREYVIAFDGRIYPSTSPDVEQAQRRIGEGDPLQGLRNLIETGDGAYAIAMLRNSEVFLARDPIGLKPLYYGESEEFVAAASERKALWDIGIREVTTFPLGHIARATASGFSFDKIQSLVQPPIKQVDMDTAVRQLKELLLASLSARTKDVEKVAVSFSGGVDSSVIALLAKLAGLEVKLISVGMEGQSELEHARRSAEELGLPLTISRFTPADLEEAVGEVLWHIEEPNLLKFSVAFPIYLAARAASRGGFKVLLAGQGSDELFGGYRRFLKPLAEGSPEKALEEIFRSVAQSHTVNYERDEKASIPHKVELRLPYADWKTIQYSLSLPLGLKIASPSDLLRKRVLRKLAETLGIPKSMSERPKKAIQYATGVSKALKNLAKKNGLDSTQYLERRFNEVFYSKG